MKFVIDLSTYRAANNAGKNSLRCLFAILERRDHTVIIDYNTMNVLWSICNDTSCNPQLRDWFIALKSEKRFLYKNTELTHIPANLSQHVSWKIIKDDLNNVALALQHGDNVILFYPILSQGCDILSQYFKMIDWKDVSKSDTACWIDAVK